MIQEVTLAQVVERLQALESTVKMLSMELALSPSETKFEFVIRVDGGEVWRGLDVVTHYPEIRRQTPRC